MPLIRPIRSLRTFVLNLRASLRRALAVPRVTDSTPYAWRGLNETNTSVTWASRRETLAKVCDLARDNPLAHRLVQITTDFVVGGGATLEGPKWAHDFWEHPLNALDMRIYRWCDTLSTQGELFIVLSRNPVDGMSYVREIPATAVDAVETDPDDLEHELRVHQLTDNPEGKYWPVAHEGDDASPQVILHYAINRPPGDVRGYSDLWHTADYLAKYDLWLQDRVRINRYKGAYLWHCRIEGASPAILDAKRNQYAKPPSSGTILVTDANEKWEVMQPTIAADDVEADGRALRLMIAAGAGVPLHFLSEGESATRATAREMGTPTYRHFAHRQYVFEHILRDVITHAARRAGRAISAKDIDVTFDMVLNLGEACPEQSERGGDPTGSAVDPQGTARRRPDGSSPPQDTGTDSSLGIPGRPRGRLVLYKHVVTRGPTCADCVENAQAGWLPASVPYPASARKPHLGSEPPFHPHCDCSEERALFEIPADEGDA